MHPALDGRSGELADLVDAIRRLTTATVTCRAAAADLAAAASTVTALAEQLEATVPDPVPHLAHTDGSPLARPGGGFSAVDSIVDVLPFDPVVGRWSPIAPHVTLTAGGDGVVGEATYARHHEGPPGWVHGGALAAAVDMVFMAATVAAGRPGPTRRLTIRYRRPTLIETPTRFEAEVTLRDERRTVVTGRVRQLDAVTAEAEAEFAAGRPG